MLDTLFVPIPEVVNVNDDTLEESVVLFVCLHADGCLVDFNVVSQ